VNAWLDGRYVASEALPKVAQGVVAPFETMGAQAGAIALWDVHLQRLAATAVRLGLPFAPTDAVRGEAAELLLQNGHADDVLRLQLVPGAGTVHVVMTTRSRGPHRAFVKLLPTVVERLPGDPPADLKASPRRFYDAVMQQAQDGGADDGIVVGTDGAVLETAIANLWLRVDGVWVTPQLDGRVLPGIARARLLERAAAVGLPTAERRCGLDLVHRAQVLAVSNAVHGPRAARLLGSAAPDVAIVDSELGRLWNRGAPGSSS
jgi:branched-subunit amino acid aminotransferase/4-amino-4-deoxychorismate lyase